MASNWNGITEEECSIPLSVVDRYYTKYYSVGEYVNICSVYCHESSRKPDPFLLLGCGLRLELRCVASYCMLAVAVWC